MTDRRDEQHADQPVLCAECEAGILARIEAGTLKDGTGYCPHNETLALVKTAGGKVLEWHLCGPMSFGDATMRVHGVAVEIARELAASAPESRM